MINVGPALAAPNGAAPIPKDDGGAAFGKAGLANVKTAGASTGFGKNEDAQPVVVTVAANIRK